MEIFSFIIKAASLICGITDLNSRIAYLIKFILFSYFSGPRRLSTNFRSNPTVFVTSG